MTSVQENPAALRQTASTIRSIADELCGYTAGVVSFSRNLGYEGPAADVYYDVLQRSHNGVHSEAESLYRLAARLEAGADEAEIRIRAESI
ncbi:hypothetical protein [Ruicaihuangia caeni]|uniref:Uncharacterized protein n=1 Tax=Ruicaihuangia caeni TaxID=3042517 RepID=A0AAW6T2Q6_9MICO|nr:hypothetical protein [Klugiella sp. YN-L-19]MDI2098105.1 hypothetical protein [Klugiella sp. YN-L-19]